MPLLFIEIVLKYFFTKIIDITIILYCELQIFDFVTIAIDLAAKETKVMRNEGLVLLIVTQQVDRY